MSKEDEILAEIKKVKSMIENLRAIVVVLAGDKVNRI